jgi:DNA-binding GntR family transcriptional regulator
LRLKQLENQRTKELIVNMLRKEILSGKIPHGTELAQEQLAETLQVSRMPIREAFQTLEYDGLLLRLQNRHMYVVGLEEKTIFQNMRVTASIESEIGIILIETDKDNISLQKLLEKSEHASSADIRDLEIQFHLTLSELTDNVYLSKTHRHLFEIYPKYVLENLKLMTSERLLFLRQIYNSLCASDIHALKKAVNESYRALGTVLLNYVKETFLDVESSTDKTSSSS